MLNSSATISIRGFNQLKPWIGFGWRSLGRWGWGGSGIAQDHPHYNNFWVGPQSHSEMPGEAIAQSSQALVQCVGCYKVNEQEPDNGPSQVLSTNAITNVIPTKTGISQWISLMFHHFWREISSPFHCLKDQVPPGGDSLLGPNKVPVPESWCFCISESWFWHQRRLTWENGD